VNGEGGALSIHQADENLSLQRADAPGCPLRVGRPDVRQPVRCGIWGGLLNIPPTGFLFRPNI